MMNLPWPAIPENASRFADSANAIADSAWEIFLNFTPESLSEVDKLIDRLPDPNFPKLNIDYFLFCLGVYTGEIFVRHADGLWRIPSALKIRHYDGLPMVIELKNGTLINPIDKPFKRYKNGAEDSLMVFYEVFTALA